MDEIMDTKVVQMKFDNSQFRAGVEDTIKQLNALENSLELQGASTGLDSVSKASKDTAKSLTAVSDATQEVERHFSALEIVGITVMMRLTNAALTYGSRMANNLWSKTLGQVISGGKARSQNIANAKFQLEGLGVAWKEIGDDISYGVKDTAYGLDEAAKAASQMVASMDLANGYTDQQSAQMRIALRAISGVAAMTNSSYSEIADVFTTVSSNGKLMTMQLRQLAARGLNASAVLAKAMNKTEEEINQMVTQGKISFQEFAKAMDEAFGKHAKEANKTFQGALSNVRAALSRIGAKFAEPVYENLRKVFNGLIPVIDNVNAALQPIVDTFTAFANIVGDWAYAFLSAESISRGLMQMAINLYSYIRPIAIAFVEVFAKYIPNIDSGTRSMQEFVHQFALVGPKAEKFRDICRSLFSIVDLFIHVATSAFKLLKTIGKSLLTIFKSLTGSMEPPLDILYRINVGLERLLDLAVNFLQAKLDKTFEAIGNALKLVNWEKILKVITNIVIVLAVAWQLLVRLVELVIEGFKRLIPMLQVAGVLLAGFISSAIQGFMVVAGLISNIFGRGRDLVTNIIVRTQGMSNTAGIFNAGEAVKEMGDSTTNLNDSVSDATDEIDELNDRLETTQKNAARATKAVVDLRNGVEDVITATAEEPSDTPLGDVMESAIAKQNQFTLGRGTSGVKKMGFFETLASYFVSDRFTAIHTVAIAIDGFFETIYWYIKDALGPFASKIQEIIDKHGGLFNTLSHVLLTGSIIAAIVWIGKLFYAILGFLDFIPAIGRAITRSSWALVLNQLAKLIAAMTLPIVAISGLVAVIATVSYLADDVEKIKDIFDLILNFVKDIANTIKEVLTYVVVIYGIYALVDLITTVHRILSKVAPRSSIIDRVSNLVKSLALLMASVAGSLYILTLAAEAPNFDKAISVLAGFGTALLAFITIISLVSYQMDSATNTIKVTWKGIQVNSTVWANSIMGICIGISVMLATMLAAVYLVSQIEDKEALKFGQKVVGTAMAAILIFVGALVAYCKLLKPTGSISEAAGREMEGMAKAVANVAKVIRALGFALIEVAAALWIVSKIQFPDDARMLNTFIAISAVIGLLTIIVSVVLPLITKGVGNDRTAATVSAMAGIALMVTALGGMLLMLAGTLRMLNGVEITGKVQGTLISIVSIITVLSAVIAGLMSAFHAGPSTLAALFGLSLVFAAIGGMFLMLGEALKTIGESIPTNKLGKVQGILISIVSIVSFISLVLGILGAIPEINIGVMAVLAIIGAVFIALGVMFEMLGDAAKKIGDGAQNLVDAIKAFIAIPWSEGIDSVKDMGKFIKAVNKQLKNINLFTLIGLTSFSYICKQIAKSIDAMRGIDEEASASAAAAISVFVETLAESKDAINATVKIAGDFAKIAWLIALGSAGLLVSSALLDGVMIALGLFVIAMELYGDRIEPAAQMFVKAIVSISETLNENEDTLKNGVRNLISFSAGVFISGGLLAAGTWFFVLAAVFMAEAGATLTDAFASFAAAFIYIGALIETYSSYLNMATKAIIGFALGANVAGVLFVLVGLEFFASAVLFGAGLEFFAQSVYNASIYFNGALEQIRAFINGLSELEDEINEMVKNSETLQLIGSVIAPFASMVYWEGYDLATDVADGYIDGSNESHDAVVAAWSGTVDDTLTAGEEKAEVNSPSKRTYRLGENIVKGLINGMEANKSEAMTCGISIANEVIAGLSTIDDQIRTKGELHAKAYSEGLNSGKGSKRWTVGSKTVGSGGGGGQDSSRVGRQGNQYWEEEQEALAESFDQSQAAAEGAEATTETYDREIQNGLGTVQNTATSFLDRLSSMFSLDLSSQGNSTITSFFTNLLNGFGINIEAISGNVKGFGGLLAAIFGDGLGSGMEAIFRLIARMTSANMTEFQQQATRSMPDWARAYAQPAIQSSNYGVIYDELFHGWDESTDLFSLPSVDDLFDYSLPTASYSAPSTTSDLASAISGSSGAGSGINDQSKAASIGGGVGNTITNSNNTYNFYQNNYSPEPLNRSAIYQQTRQQLNGFYTYVKEKNLSY